MSGYPEIWLRDSITEATGAQAYPVMAPETAATPYVVYSRSGTERDLAMPTISRAPLAAFDLYVVTDRYMDGKELAEQIRVKCNNFVGEYAGCTITSCNYQPAGRQPRRKRRGNHTKLRSGTFLQSDMRNNNARTFYRFTRYELLITTDTVLLYIHCAKHRRCWRCNRSTG